jgi:predicted DNA-binding transcriptional regulator AlpA
VPADTKILRTKKRTPPGPSPVVLLEGCPEVLSRPRLLKALGICNATLINWIRRRNFPRAIILGDKVFRWRRADVHAWMLTSAVRDAVAAHPEKGVARA